MNPIWVWNEKALVHVTNCPFLRFNCIHSQKKKHGGIKPKLHPTPRTSVVVTAWPGAWQPADHGSAPATDNAVTAARCQGGPAVQLCTMPACPASRASAIATPKLHIATHVCASIHGNPRATLSQGSCCRGLRGNWPKLSRQGLLGNGIHSQKKKHREAKHKLPHHPAALVPLVLIYPMVLVVHTLPTSSYMIPRSPLYSWAWTSSCKLWRGSAAGAAAANVKFATEDLGTS